MSSNGCSVSLVSAGIICLYLVSLPLRLLDLGEAFLVACFLVLFLLLGLGVVLGARFLELGVDLGGACVGDRLRLAARVRVLLELQLEALDGGVVLISLLAGVATPSESLVSMVV
jgi:hypothetical protein